MTFEGQCNHDLALCLHALGLVPRAGKLSTGVEDWASEGRFLWSNRSVVWLCGIIRATVCSGIYSRDREFCVKTLYQPQCRLA